MLILEHAAIKKTQVLFSFVHCWDSVDWAGSGDRDLFLTLTFFLLFPVREPLPSAELVSSRKSPCFHFVLSIPSQTYLFSWELTSFAAVRSVPVSFPSDSVFDVLLSGSAGEAELLCPHWKGLCGVGDPRTDYSWIFSRVLHCFKLCVSVPRLKEDGVKYYGLFLLCTKRTFHEIYSLQHAVDIDTLFT